MADRLPDQLAAITHSSETHFEDAMLRVYSSLITQLCATAALGMNRLVIRPNAEAIGVNSAFFPPAIIAQAMVKLLRADGLEANIAGNASVFVRWPALPTHWSNDN